MDDTEQQPPLKRMEIDGPISVPSSNSSPSHLPGETSAISNSGDTNAGPSSPSSSQMPAEIVSDTKSKGNGKYLKTSAILTQVWKDDLNSGHLLVSLFELFGESILSFIPAPEMSLFI